ncbi:hypothetical protein RRG08_034627 [Elysia crispata]|uniref:Uncharacterized protein n=1 Tax=Elysia crispata TaxID=231223 RepID=A0AAE1B355_9GAST|nr:hypothetical protein RRG08_034627 [Elysia crispata]
MYSSFLKHSVRCQVLLFFCGLVFVFGCVLLVHSGQGRWTANIRLQNDEVSQTSIPKQRHDQVSSFRKVDIGNIQINITYLTKLLQYRLALPNDALKFNHRSPCKEHANDSQPCLKENCPDLSNKSLQERIEELVLAPHFQLEHHQLQNILSVVSDVSESDVIIVSASSSNHFKEMQAMFKALHRTVYPVLKNFNVILFDIGLKKKQRRLTEKYCKCQVLSFPFKQFPTHVRELLCYSWKAIIIRALVTKARKLLIWQDTSIRWTEEFPSVFQRAMKYGQQLIESTHGARITSHTHPQMFAYMREEACQYFPYREIQCGFQVMKNDPLVIQAILNPWTRCALEEPCICPVYPKSVIRCSKGLSSTLPRCHRFDQSAMSIILSKLYAADRYRFMVPEYSTSNPKSR